MNEAEWKKSLQPFVGRQVLVSIEGPDGEEKAPAVPKTLARVHPNEEHTHIKWYFDLFTFVAVPMDARTEISENSVKAFDPEANLYYKLVRTTNN
ncbi:hypothetical protein [Paenibacillus turpanensis]|uniref:hypothetical protein n=1 Tax=Paenibacillus turpanensis TaxID=2689078 RepID=UPI00140C9D7A|nr:hypothetical protein [Paenibacillus turpanensis]